MRVAKLSLLNAALLMLSVLAGCATNVPQSETRTPLLSCDESLIAAFRPDALTRVIAVKAFRQGDPLVVSEPVTERTPRAPNDLCMVKLNVGPGNPGPEGAPSTSPGIGIEVWLPSPQNWNGRLHNIGGRGGYDGGTQGSPTQIGWLYAAMTAGHEGAVSASTDSGHAASNGAWGMNPDGTLAAQLWTDYAHRAQHEMALKTKALTEAFYGRPPRYSYYSGSSTGGRHGYMLAQQYPDDYDGIIGNLSAMNWSEWTTAGVYRALVVERDLGGVPLTEAQLDLVSNAAIRACDVVGGEHLGYILDNFACAYDPTRDRDVLCQRDGGANRTPDCVTRLQANAVNKFWYGPTADGSVPSPAVDNGARPILEGNRRWYGLARGTSLYNWYYTRGPGLAYMTGATGAAGAANNSRAPRQNNGGYIADQVALNLGNPAIADPSFLNASGNGQGLWRGLSYAQLAEAFDRGVALDAAYGGVSSDDPDLSAFQASGGKFLSWHGWNDEAIPVQGTMQYYDRVVEHMDGLDNVQSFFRLYVVPGGGHESPQGTSNPEASPPTMPGDQFYQALTNWVENGVAPGRIDASSPPSAPVRITQPLCPYPQRAIYRSGDPRAAASFECQ